MENIDMKLLRIAFCAVFLLLSGAAHADMWYEGGTLQKATVADWTAATPENQLATSADFIASLNSVPDISKASPGEQENIRKLATDLRNCVDETATHPDTPRDKAVAELVVLCTVMKK